MTINQYNFNLTPRQPVVNNIDALKVNNYSRCEAWGKKVRSDDDQLYVLPNEGTLRGSGVTADGP